MGAKEEGLEDGEKRAGLDGCVILAFASILGFQMARLVRKGRHWRCQLAFIGAHGGCLLVGLWRN